MQTQKSKKTAPRRIEHPSEIVARIEKEEKKQRFWKSLMWNNLGGKKGHDN